MLLSSPFNEGFESVAFLSLWNYICRPTHFISQTAVFRGTWTFTCSYFQFRGTSRGAVPTVSIVSVWGYVFFYVAYFVPVPVLNM